MAKERPGRRLWSLFTLSRPWPEQMAIDAVGRRMLVGLLFAVIAGTVVAADSGWLLGIAVGLAVFTLASGLCIAALVLVARRQR